MFGFSQNIKNDVKHSFGKIVVIKIFKTSGFYCIVKTSYILPQCIQQVNLTYVRYDSFHIFSKKYIRAFDFSFSNIMLY